jgi:hypothetical protein
MAALQGILCIPDRICCADYKAQHMRMTASGGTTWWTLTVLPRLRHVHVLCSAVCQGAVIVACYGVYTKAAEPNCIARGENKHVTTWGSVDVLTHC